MKTLAFYLAHPVDSFKIMREWQKEIEKKLDITIINPLIVEMNQFKGETDKNKKYAQIDSKKLVQRDVRLISISDGIISVVDGSQSYGTIQEKVYAKMLGKPDLCVVSNGEKNNPWLKYPSSKIVPDLDTLGIYVECFTKKMRDSKKQINWEKLVSKEEEEKIQQEIRQISTKNKANFLIGGKTDYGTIQKMVYAHNLFQKPTYTLVTNGQENHPWIKYHSDKVFTNNLEMKRFLENK